MSETITILKSEFDAMKAGEESIYWYERWMESDDPGDEDSDSSDYAEVFNEKKKEWYKLRNIADAEKALSKAKERKAMSKRTHIIEVPNERFYLAFAERVPKPTQLGRHQFMDLESRGIQPENPDPFYLKLCEGRHWSDWQRNEIKRSYLRWEWEGWQYLIKRWRGDLPLLEFLCNWYTNFRTVVVENLRRLKCDGKLRARWGTAREPKP